MLWMEISWASVPAGQHRARMWGPFVQVGSGRYEEPSTLRDFLASIGQVFFFVLDKVLDNIIRQLTQ